MPEVVVFVGELSEFDTRVIDGVGSGVVAVVKLFPETAVSTLDPAIVPCSRRMMKVKIRPTPVYLNSSMNSDFSLLEWI